MESVLEDIEFLALSANRVTALTRLAEGPRSRGELAAATGASQPTLGRILGDFEERRWVRRTDDGRYVATPTGRLVADGFDELVDTFETERTLRSVVQWLPTEGMEFDLRRLRGATITAPSRTRPNAPVQGLLDLLERTDHVRFLSHAFNEQTLEVVERRTAAGDQRLDGVFSPGAIEALADDAGLREHLRGLLDTERAEIRICEAEVPLAVTIADDTVHLLLRDDRGILQASLESEDEAVREWALAAHERYWEGATPLDPSALDG
ncbi:helix-turn-helix transcriptional regulator [Halobium salinum]|uniref:Helix-turn-helix transcriptional regulator n=1 Tax=Halobium salinum TaxID=1364940 RepID=A0ABD5P9R6_9EURY|nr:transcriptional regulator FilR1 domain-containing protein [Halobium salinum]